MDSASGGIPSPVIENKDGIRSFYPLPIPYEPSGVAYEQVQLFESYSAQKFINDVCRTPKNFAKCHLDPDLHIDTLKDRPNGWVPGFGQMGAAQSHLDRHSVSTGDLFLFFGWFQYAEIKEGKFSYTRRDEYPNGFHAIYGYFRIDEVFKLDEDEVPLGLVKHPHVFHKDNRRFAKNNTVYTARKSFSNDGLILPGCGYLNFSEELILTGGEDRTKRSIWALPKEFAPSSGFDVSLSYNPQTRWQVNGDRAILEAAFRGQEFVFYTDPHKHVANWAHGLVARHGISL